MTKMGSEKSGPRRGGWVRRVLAGTNVVSAVLLATTWVLLINGLVARHMNLRWNLSTRGYYQLSDKTKQLLAGLEGDFQVVAFFQKSHPHFDDVRRLLAEYKAEAEKNRRAHLRISFVDPDRDLVAARDLARKYDVGEANVVLFERGGRTTLVEEREIAEYEQRVDLPKLLRGERGGVEKILKGFYGEQAFSSAIQGITQNVRPTVYFLSGHGERDIGDYRKHTGYASLARIIRRDNVDVKPLVLGDPAGLPADCSALVVAGPTRKLSEAEVGMLAATLERNGRMLVMIDPRTATGLDRLLETWGVRLASDVALGPGASRGRELMVSEYGDHPVTRRMRKVMTTFSMPRCVDPVESPASAGEILADKPRVTVLAANTAEGWREADLDQNPPRYDAGIDRPGPAPVAVAVEKGIPGAGIRPTCMVVIGDSYFVSNGALETSVGGNADFFMSALNWLLEREVLMAVSPKTPDVIRLGLTRQGMTVVSVILVGAIPLVVALVGIWVWVRRRE